MVSFLTKDSSSGVSYLHSCSVGAALLRSQVGHKPSLSSLQNSSTQSKMFLEDICTFLGMERNKQNQHWKNDNNSKALPHYFDCK